MLMRTPFAPAAISCSTISGSREAGPRVISIFAFLKIWTCPVDVKELEFAVRFRPPGQFCVPDSFPKPIRRSTSLPWRSKTNVCGIASLSDSRKLTSSSSGFASGVLNTKLFCEGWDLFFVAWSTNVESNHYQPLVFILLLKSDQMRNTIAARNTPRRIEIQHQHFAFVLGEDGALSICELPSHVDQRIAAHWRHGISGVVVEQR